MHLFRSMTDCHRRLMASAETLRGELDGDGPSARLLRLRFEMSIAARDNLATTQQLWSRIKREIPDIARRIQGYDRLKAAERDLHVRYTRHIAAWPVAAISKDFNNFAGARKQFLDDLCRHTRLLEIEFFEPAVQNAAKHGQSRRAGGVKAMLSGTA